MIVFYYNNHHNHRNRENQNSITIIMIIIVIIANHTESLIKETLNHVTVVSIKLRFW